MILQRSIPYPVGGAVLLGMAPLSADGWIIHDEAFSGQMMLRDDLLSRRRDDVFAEAQPDPAAKAEVLEMVLKAVSARDGYVIKADHVVRPDQVAVALNGDPMVAAAHLIQEDLLLHEHRNGEWTLTAGVLCFPASWTLAEKIGQGLTRIHKPVPEYDGNITKRVARLFDGIQPDRPMWRHNVLTYADPSLHHPRTEASPRDGDHDGQFKRSEHQALVRLPTSNAVLFAIHTYVVRSTAE